MRANKKAMHKAVAWILAAMLLFSGQAATVFAGESEAADQSSTTSQSQAQTTEKGYLAKDSGSLKRYDENTDQNAAASENAADEKSSKDEEGSDTDSDIEKRLRSVRPRIRLGSKVAGRSRMN